MVGLAAWSGRGVRSAEWRTVAPVGWTARRRILKMTLVIELRGWFQHRIRNPEPTGLFGRLCVGCGTLSVSYPNAVPQHH